MKIKDLVKKFVTLLRISQKNEPKNSSREDQLIETQKLVAEARQHLSSLQAKEHALSQSISAERNNGPLLSVEYKTLGKVSLKIISVLRPTTVWDLLTDLEQRMPQPELTRRGFVWYFKKNGVDLPEIEARKFWGDKGVAFQNDQAQEVISMTDYLDKRSATTLDGVMHRVGVIMFIKDHDSQLPPAVKMWICKEVQQWSSVTDTVLMAPIGPGSTIILKEEKPAVQE